MEAKLLFYLVSDNIIPLYEINNNVDKIRI